MTRDDPIPALIGATASGKTAVGVALAREAGGEVICCDAFAVYQGMAVLTAAPEAPADVPHHLVGFLNPEGCYSAMAFSDDVDRLVPEIRARGRTAWIVGGTALYLRGWLKGFGAPVSRDAALRERLQARVDQAGPAALHADLAAVDPARAAALHPNDVRRVTRALEIHTTTGKRASEQRADWDRPDRVPATVICLRRARDDLRARIRQRTDQMFEAGVVEEARALLAGKLSPEAAYVLGLSELRQLLAGEIDEAQARERIATRTAQYARKQMTFFRSFTNAHVLDLAPDEPAGRTAERVREILAVRG